MTYRAERFNRSMRSLEAMVSGMADDSKSTKLSDRGKTAARMYAAFEPEPDAPDRDQELTGAVLRLIVEGMDYLVPPLLLIAENGNDRTRSIALMACSRKSGRGRKKFESARKAYKRCLKSLLNFFDVQSVHMEI